MSDEHGQYSGVVDIARNGVDEVIRLRSVIKILEQDVREAKQGTANALGTRKVLWNLLGECLPLLEVDAQWSTDYESKEAIEALIVRIKDARGAVQAEEMPGRLERS